MVNKFKAFNTGIGRISIELILEHAALYGGFFPLPDYVKKISLTNHLEEHLTIFKQGGIFSLPELAIALILGRVMEIERDLSF